MSNVVYSVKGRVARSGCALALPLTVHLERKNRMKEKPHSHWNMSLHYSTTYLGGLWHKAYLFVLIATPFSPSENKICASCCTTKTPLWRDAEDGTPLCNACGIRWVALNTAHYQTHRHGPEFLLVRSRGNELWPCGYSKWWQWRRWFDDHNVA